MLTLMGHSGTIPSAIRAKDVADRLAVMQQALQDLQQHKDDGDPDDPDEEKSNVPVDRRAFPLMEMMKQAIRTEEDVMWDYERPLF